MVNAVKPFAGYILTSWWHDQYFDSYSVLSQMKDTGVTHVEIIVTQYMNNIYDTYIRADGNKTPTDDAVISAINTAKQLGLTPILKPHVDLYDSTWRGYIGNGYSQQYQWDQWWSNYSKFITHYAQIAASHGADAVFNIGTELDATEKQEQQWRNVISQVRQKLPKRTQILYGCNWYPDVNAVNWWDAVDLIGVDAYYPLSQSQYPSLSELKSNWKPIMNNLNSIHQKFGKKIVFAEIGYASYADAAKNPAGCCWGGNRNDLQQNLFEAFFETVWTQPWFGGAFWWDWEVQKKYTDFYSNNYDSLGKPAQDVVKKYYKQQSMSFEAENSEFLQ